ncbi:MAG: Nramp family divalent metal transporter [Candidatus Latescibacterota bacterium]|nr:Nramp family divalent metal transporter [Candidatus Latescibacterota bacterium]
MSPPDRKTLEIPVAPGVFTEPWSLRKIRGLFAVFGPAAIVASVSIGAGETIVVVRAGAWAGYDLLWLVLLAVIVKGVFVTYLLGRFTAVSGEPIGHRLVHMPGPRGWMPMLMIACEMIGAPLGWVAIGKPCGDLLHHLLRPDRLAGGDEVFWQNLFTTGLIVLALGLALRLSFEHLERQQLLICIILVVGTTLGTLMVRPDLAAALAGALNFGHLPEFPPWTPESVTEYPALTMATTFGYVGGGVFIYIAYSNWVGLHGWGMAGHPRVAWIRKRALANRKIDFLPEGPAGVRRMRQLISPVRWDVGTGAIVLFVVTAAFMISGAAVLYPLQSRFEGWALLTEQAHVWRVIHPALVWIYYVCIVAALWGTLQALPEIYARVIQEMLAAVRPEREWSYDRLKRVICLYIFVSATLVIWLGIAFDTLTAIAGFILANFAIFLIALAALYLNRTLPACYRTHLIVEFGTWVAVLVLGASAVVSGHGLLVRFG